jgi:ketosteroid isomerase-like protein
MEDTVRAIYAGWRAGDFKTRLDLWDPGAVLVLHPEFPDAGTYVGLDEIAGYMRQFLEPWVRLTLEPEELITGKDVVVAPVVQRGAGRGSGLDTEFRYFQVWALREGKVVRMECIRERSDALRAAGLPAT